MSKEHVQRINDAWVAWLRAQENYRQWLEENVGKNMGKNMRENMEKKELSMNSIWKDAKVTSKEEPSDYEKLANQLGKLVTEKQRQYGDSVTKSTEIMKILYPEGVKPYQYADLLLTVRILDKLSRISQRSPDGKDLGGESPYSDLAGYGLLGQVKDQK